LESDLEKYKIELSLELARILNYWKSFTVDEINGGFVGKIDAANRIDFSAPKGSVLNARILWTFSAAYKLKKNPDDLLLANRAFNYITTRFIDEEFGGVYWSLDSEGDPLDTKKQVYAIAFTIYAFSEFFIASQDEVARDQAIALYQKLVRHSYDAKNGGYFEAFKRDWTALDDLRLSDKDANEKKTMNTHLHVLEAFTTLYRIWPDPGLKVKIVGLIHDFTEHIVNKATGNLILFFDEHWETKSDVVSFGHDIEASWLLLEAAEVVREEELIELVKALAIRMAQVAKSGIDPDGSLWYEYEPSKNLLIKEKHWWVQAEAIVGFFNAWQISQEEAYLKISLQNWAFVKSRIIDYPQGEWFWGIAENGEIMPNQDKVGIWKCPYHNSRACMELIRRIDHLLP